MKQQQQACRPSSILNNGGISSILNNSDPNKIERTIRNKERRTSFNDTVVKPTRRRSSYSEASSASLSEHQHVTRMLYHRRLSVYTNNSSNSSGSKGKNGSLKARSNRHTGIRYLSDLIPCLKANDCLLNVMMKILHHYLWNWTITILDFVLLFGVPIQHLFFNKNSDTIFDALYMNTMIFLLADIVLMSHVIPNYFVFAIGEIGVRKTEKVNRCGCWPPIRIGSFLFWFDFISALSLLWEISFLGTPRHIMHRTDIYVDADGVMTYGFDSYGIFGQKYYFFNLITVVVRTPRIARFLNNVGLIRISISCQQWFESCVKWCGEPLEEEEQFDHTTLADSACLSSMTTTATTSLKASGSTNPKALTNTSISASNNNNSNSKNNNTLPQRKKEMTMSNTKKKLMEELVKTKKQAQEDAYRHVEVKKTSRKRHKGSRVGTDLHENTVKFVTIGIIVALTFGIVFTIHERSMTIPLQVVSFHRSMTNLDRHFDYTNYSTYYEDSANVLIKNGHTRDGNLLQLSYRNITFISSDEILNLRGSDTWEIIVACKDTLEQVSRTHTICGWDHTTIGIYDTKIRSTTMAIASIIFMIFIMFVWYFCVTAFTGPISTLIVYPIERMIKLLAIMVKDPLGYQHDTEYNKFVSMDKEVLKNSTWNPDTLAGMETSFLMSTILRIGSLLRVGFGSAGAEIIRVNLGVDSTPRDLKNGDQHEASVHCIFLFCDIRKFTDATECLREEVFVFTNKIAAVVHSLCHAYGGSANKNIGDAFLLCWALPTNSKKGRLLNTMKADDHEADKALLATVKIVHALSFEDYYSSSMSEIARDRLKEKFSEVPGPLVQMGFGLHVGKAVQGAIGSERKLDATYISNAVEQVEYLESSTKKYGVKLLLSGQFHQLLDPSVQRKSRKIDQIFFREDDCDDFEEPPDPLAMETMELYTFDFNVSNLTIVRAENRPTTNSIPSSHDSQSSEKRKGWHSSYVSTSQSSLTTTRKRSKSRRNSFWNHEAASRTSISRSSHVGSEKSNDNEVSDSDGPEDCLELPNGPLSYNRAVWNSPELRFMRRHYIDGAFFQKFNAGLECYFEGNWRDAKEKFEFVDGRFNDGPSRYFLKKMKKTNYVPPRYFTGYGEA